MLESLVVIAPLSPLVACVLTLVIGGALPRGWIRWLNVATSLLTLAVASGLIVLQSNSSDATVPQVEVYRWIAASPTLPVDVAVSLAADRVSLLMLATVAFAALCVAAAGGDEQDEKQFRLRLAVASFALFAAAMLVLSANFLQMFIFWEMTLVAGYLMNATAARTVTSAVATRNLFLVNRASDGLFVFGTLMVLGNFGSLEFAQVLSNREALASLAAASPATMATLCFCLMIPLMVRAAQFPFFSWLDESSRAPVQSNALVHGVVIAASGFVAMRCFPLFEASAEARAIMGFLGALTALLAGTIAAAEREPRRVLCYSSSVLFGLVLMALATGAWLGFAAAILLIVAHTLVKPALFIAIGEPAESGEDSSGDGGSQPRYAAFTMLAASVVLSLSMHGQNAIFSAHWEPVGDAPTSGLFGLPASTSRLVLLALAAAGQFLIAFALFRLVLHVWRRERSASWQRDAGLADGLGLLGSLVALLLLPVAAGATNWFETFLSPGWSQPVEVGGLAGQLVGAGTLVGLLGFVAGWLADAIVRSRGMQDSSPPGPLARLGRNRFYLDDMFFLSLVLPTRAFAQLCRFFDWLLIDGLLVGLPAKIPNAVAKVARPLQGGMVQFYALSLLLAVAVLAVISLWFEG